MKRPFWDKSWLVVFLPSTEDTKCNLSALMRYHWQRSKHHPSTLMRRWHRRQYYIIKRTRTLP